MYSQTKASEQPAKTVTHWHAMVSETVLQQLESRGTGLTSGEAQSRLERYGPNRLPPPRPRSGWVRLLSQFHNVLIYVLLGAAAVTLLLGHWIDAGVIVGVVVINAVIGFIQEGKAERAMEAVRNMLSPQAWVSRDGHRVTLPADQLTPGDVVHVQSGDRIPADVRLLKARDLHVDEAILTGESLPVAKSTEPVAAESVLGDRTCLGYSGTLVTFGQGTGVVVSTGHGTEIGRISVLLSQVEVLTTPLLRQLAVFGRWLTGVIAVTATLTFLFGILVRDYAASDMFLAAVGLAVAAIPEGLPAIITIALAVGVQRMSRRNAIVRRLPAVETLGSVTVICSDKTGTLTRNEMTVQSVVLDSGVIEVSGSGYEPHGTFSRDGVEIRPDSDPVLQDLIRSAMLCNDAGLRETTDGWRIEGDPTEGALVVLGFKAGIEPALLAEQLPRADVIPFESEHRFMATLHHDHAGHASIFMKGAPEVVLSRCATVRGPDGEAALDVDLWMERVASIAENGFRPLAIAMKTAAPQKQNISFSDVEDRFQLLGLVGIIDPPRDEAIAAIQRCMSAGIRVKMITGDHAGTAQAIAERVGLSGTAQAIAERVGLSGTGQPLTGDELNKLDAEGFQAAARDHDVFARVSPEHKLKLVTALQASGQVVAMTGDGVNDAPALKRADVGVAMGIKGTEAAKEAAEMVLADDNFATIGYAVEEGRTVYDNIKKAILFVLPTNGGEALTIIAAIAFGRLLPVTAAQILWVNMVTAVTLALALAFEPPESHVMKNPPRDPAQPMLTGFMWWRISFVALIMVVVTFGLFLIEREAGASIESARTVAVNALVMLEVFYLFSTRYLYRGVLSLDGLFGSRYVLSAIAVVVGLQMILTYTPVMWRFFHTQPIGFESWLRILLFSSLVLFLVELEKLALRRWRGGRTNQFKARKDSAQGS